MDATPRRGHASGQALACLVVLAYRGKGQALAGGGFLAYGVQALAGGGFLAYGVQALAVRLLFTLPPSAPG